MSRLDANQQCVCFSSSKKHGQLPKTIFLYSLVFPVFIFRGLEEVGVNYYAYSPIFLPNREPINFYKKNITNSETVLSGGRIIDYRMKCKGNLVLALMNALHILFLFSFVMIL